MSNFTLKLGQICPILGQSDPIWMPNLISLSLTEVSLDVRAVSTVISVVDTCVERSGKLLSEAVETRPPSNPLGFSGTAVVLETQIV